MAALIDAISVKRRTLFEFENTPFYCLEAEVNTPTARGGQTLVRLKVRNMLTSAVFEKTFKAGDKFKEPDMQKVPASYLYSGAGVCPCGGNRRCRNRGVSEEIASRAVCALQAPAQRRDSVPVPALRPASVRASMLEFYRLPLPLVR